MLLRLQITLLVILFSAQMGISQDSWKKLSSTADKLFEEGSFAEAGDKYFAAWKMKPKKEELAFKAGDAYLMTRDYTKAAKAYKVVKDNNSDYHHVGFKYARCLKSLEQYDEASREFVYFINNYDGDDFQSMSELVQTEILGCEMAIKDANEQTEGVVVTHLSESVNSGDMEYAPLPYTDDIIYFSSDKSGSSKIYRSQNLDGSWTQSKATDNIFSSVSREHYGNVSFAPDNSRFYFTQCDATYSTNSKCDIYVVESKADGSWSAPIILPEYVNDPNSTNTHPCVVHANGKETIYFSSSRPGGKGGMDLWYTSRDLNSSSMDFTFPKNLGSRINTAGEDMTPFYDTESNTLYFSSDGHIGYGGFDVYQSKGSDFDWEKPTNMGKPINSAQDDRYYIFESSPESGFLVSNRKSDLSKLTTTDEDIFHFGEDISELMVKGKLKDASSKGITGVKVTLYEVSSNGQKRIITSQTLDNKYKFPLIEDKAYVLEASKPGYSSAVYEFDFPKGSTSLGHDLMLSNTASASAPSVPTTPSLPPSSNNIPSPPTNPNPVADTTTEMETTTPPAPPVKEDVVVETTTPPSPPANDPSTNWEETEPVFEEIVETPPPTPTVVTEPRVIDSQPVTADPVPFTTPATNHSTTEVSSSNPVVNHSSTSSHTTTSSSSSPSALDRSWYPNHGSSTSSSSGNHSSQGSSSHSGSGSSTDYNAVTAYQGGTYYKIQMEAMKYYNSGKYSIMNDIGTVEVEGIPEKSLVRILLGNYFNKEDAIAAREEARNRGFGRAYVVKYQDGQRKAIKVFYNE